MVETSQLAWNNASCGIAIVNADGGAIFLNRMAQEIVAQGRGLVLQSNLLTATDATAAARLADCIWQAAATEAKGRSACGSAVKIARDGEWPLLVLVAPLPPPEQVVASEPAAMLLMTDPNRRSKPIGRHLIDWFGLSQAEATLAVQLADGARLECLAERRSVRVSTLRSQLSAILSKTGTTRQPELIRLLHKLPAAYQPDQGNA